MNARKYNRKEKKTTTYNFISNFSEYNIKNVFKILNFNVYTGKSNIERI